MDNDQVLAEAVKLACIRAAQQGYEQASISGLCAEGALEAAIGAVRMVDVEEIIRKIKSGT
jgi:hypothetical protein